MIIKNHLTHRLHIKCHADGKTRCARAAAHQREAEKSVGASYFPLPLCPHFVWPLLRRRRPMTYLQSDKCGCKM